MYAISHTICQVHTAQPPESPLKIYENNIHNIKQESPAIADKPARRKNMPKIAPIRRAYNVVADYTGLSSCV